MVIQPQVDASWRGCPASLERISLRVRTHDELDLTASGNTIQGADPGSCRKCSAGGLSQFIGPRNQGTRYSGKNGLKLTHHNDSSSCQTLFSGRVSHPLM